jgi:hypothetical protein
MVARRTRKKKYKYKNKNKNKKRLTKRGGNKKKRIKKRRRKRKVKKEFSLNNIRKDKCAPKKKGEDLDFSCYTPGVLLKMRDIWNKRHPDSKIETNNVKEIWETLAYYMKSTCRKESCWIKNKLFKGKIEKSDVDNIFSPKQPEEWKKNPMEWLSSIEILQFMKQYENAYHCFEFLGPSPIDYDAHISHGECVWEDLCEFDLKKTIERGKKKIGIIFNLDEHNRGGSHWVAMFVNSNLGEIYYFDSYGDPAPKQLRKLGWEIQKQSEKFGKRYKYKSNKIRHQYTESECGMYCLYFVVELLKDKPFDFFHKRILDKKVISLRNKYFNKN